LQVLAEPRPQRHERGESHPDFAWNLFANALRPGITVRFADRLPFPILDHLPAVQLEDETLHKSRHALEAAGMLSIEPDHEPSFGVRVRLGRTKR
jgi:hypothetical protein